MDQCEIEVFNVQLLQVLVEGGEGILVAVAMADGGVPTRLNLALHPQLGAWCAGERDRVPNADLIVVVVGAVNASKADAG